MSVQRAILPVATYPSTFFRFASSTSRACSCTTRHFTSSLGGRLSTKRKLVTSSSYRPQSLDPSPPPRNADVPDTSISGAMPRIHDIRPPEMETQEAMPAVAETPKVSIIEEEAQKSKPANAPQEVTPTTSKPKRPKLRPRKAAMTLTPTAIEHLKLLLEQPDPKLIRVGVKNRGCSGLAYHLEYVAKPGTFDEAVEQDGVKVLIDSKALFSIIGSEMDWVEDKLNQRFVFKNPNIKEQCGCGESFMV